MIRHHVKVAAGVLGTFAAGLLATTSFASAEVTYERLVNPEPGNWLTHNRTYDSNRYSPLDQINRDNVGGLRMAFALPLAPSEQGAFVSSALQGTPLVDDGIMYFSDGWGRVYQIDLTAGDRAFINWIMDPATDRETDGINNNRGVALLGDMVYSITLDGYLIGTDAATGEVVFEEPTEQNPAEYFTMAPLALEDAIIMGPAGGDGPMRGRIEARSPEDGSLIWTWHTIPGPGEPGNETWGGDSWEIGGAAIWVTGAYDPDQNIVVWGIGNPQPDYDPSARPGDNLYSDSSVALNADTGELEWYFQYTPNDSWDYDEVGTNQLFEVDGQQVVGHFARNGFYYNLDGTNGAFLNGGQYVDEVNWTEGLDEKTGLPLEYDPNLAVQTYIPEARPNADGQMFFCPNLQGGTNMFPTTYSHRTNLVYASAIEGCSTQGGLQDERANAQTGSITAVAAATGEVAVKADLPFVAYGGNVSTAGGLVFGSTVNGDFFAMDDETLEILWNINLGSSIEAPPISFEVNGQQMIALPVGPGGIVTNFMNYPGRGAGENAAALANMQRPSMLYFFAL